MKLIKKHLTLISIMFCIFILVVIFFQIKKEQKNLSNDLEQLRGEAKEVYKEKWQDNNYNKNEEIYKLNDLITINNGIGTMNLRFLSVKETNERNEFYDENFKKIIILEYQYENVNLDDDFYIDENNFKVYDKENNILDTYPIEVNFANAISKGRKATNKISYGLNSDNNYIEIELRSQSTNKYLNKKVILEW